MEAWISVDMLEHPKNFSYDFSFEKRIGISKS